MKAWLLIAFITHSQTGVTPVIVSDWEGGYNYAAYRNQDECMRLLAARANDADSKNVRYACVRVRVGRR